MGENTKIEIDIRLAQMSCPKDRLNSIAEGSIDMSMGYPKLREIILFIEVSQDPMP